MLIMSSAMGTTLTSVTLLHTGNVVCVIFFLVHPCMLCRSQCRCSVDRETHQPGGVRAGEETQHVVSKQLSEQHRYITL